MTLRTAKRIIRLNYALGKQSPRQYRRYASRILLVREWARAELVTAAETIMREVSER